MGEGTTKKAEAPDDGSSLEPARSPRDWLGGAPLSERVHLALGFLLPSVLLLWNLAKLRPFTIDDAYISYRYSRNFAKGLGLVYNEGERIEGYTNFSWTLLLGLGIKLGLDPDIFAKAMGGAAACGVLWAAYQLEARLMRYRSLPAISPWLLASSVPFVGYSVFGLETGFFIFLVLIGTEMIFRENDRGDWRTNWRTAFPWSGLVFGLAGITRPEAPAFLGIPMLFLGLRFFAPQNLLRGVLFVAPVGLHMLWRKSYYGGWLPNTLSAKTGNLDGQIKAGLRYVTEYAGTVWPALFLALFGLCLAIILLHRRALCLAAMGLFVAGYTVLVGGDWMPMHRFMAPFEPYAFIVAGFGARALFDGALDGRRSERAWRYVAYGGLVLAVIVAGGTTYQRGKRFAVGEERILRDEKVFWDSAAGGTAHWMLANTEPGEIGVGDIGYIGYVTDFPILDLLGLVDPVISKLPGGYTQKTGAGYVEHVFNKMPRYFVFIGSREGCDKLAFPSQDKLRRHPKFVRAGYKATGKIKHAKGGYWCVFDRGPGEPPPMDDLKDVRAPRPAVRTLPPGAASAVAR
jgi:hypothetical protein